MIKMTRTGRISTLAAGLLLVAGTAFAGPKMTFGPDDEGALRWRPGIGYGKEPI